ncbi:prolyl oligopeptidase family serine peptidase [Thermogymnomonas acidicola]|uniref:alpha/beta hydrolase family protein n=1 Tax=Thermogymnomonas acidicola TaxID=399579 RepID=UPI000AA1AF3B|nr:prolyl oligopeptidase family serine peptidase [Thermogymnomonas acidicola]
MTNVAIVKSNRFACAVSEMPVSNLLSMLGTSDIGFWFNAVESGIEDPWSRESQERLLRMSPPIYSVKDARTPTMYIHGEEDFRCPIEQSEQMFMALRYYGVDSELVRYSGGDSHEHARHGRPQNMVDRLERKLAWFRKYMVDGGGGGGGGGRGAAP